jgi:hypothetical protein
MCAWSLRSARIQPRGTVRLRDVSSLDMKVRKTFRSQGRKFEPRIDFYNLTNKATITNWIETLGSS